MAEDHVVGEDESVNSVAYRAGFFWQTLWDHPKNAELKKLRGDPDLLYAGDVVHVPDKRPKDHDAATEKLHRFRLKGTPAKFVIVLTRPPASAPVKERSAAGAAWEYVEQEVRPPAPEPAADVPFELLAEGALLKRGRTGKDGRIEATLRPDAQDGVLVLDPGTPEEQRIELNFREMDPAATIPGVCKRLVNLGYGCPVASEVTPAVAAAVAAFQRDHGLPVTGVPDDATRDEIRKAHGG